MKNFKNHDTWSIISIIVLILNFVLGVFYTLPFLQMIAGGGQAAHLGLGILHIILITANAFLAHQLFRKNVKAIYYCFAFWGLQAIGIEMSSWGLSISTGLSFFTTFGLGSMAISLNWFAIAALIILSALLKNLKITKQCY